MTSYATPRREVCALLQSPCGDTQYLTAQEYKTFKENREKLKT